MSLKICSLYFLKQKLTKTLTLKFHFVYFLSEYRWKFTVSEDRQPLRTDMGLRKDYPLTTEYFYRYHNTHTSYNDARKFCWRLGYGWGLATFQSLFVQATLKRHDKNKVVSYYENPYWREYERRNYTHWSEQNVM